MFLLNWNVVGWGQGGGPEKPLLRMENDLPTSERRSSDLFLRLQAGPRVPGCSYSEFPPMLQWASQWCSCFWIASVPLSNPSSALLCSSPSWNSFTRWDFRAILTLDSHSFPSWREQAATSQQKCLGQHHQKISLNYSLNWERIRGRNDLQLVLHLSEIEMKRKKFVIVIISHLTIKWHKRHCPAAVTTTHLQNSWVLQNRNFPTR